MARHKLEPKPNSKMVKQRLHRFSLDRKAAFKEELSKLLAARSIEEILYLEWLTDEILTYGYVKSRDQWFPTEETPN